MAHNITDRDGMFTVRQPAWHGLGEVLPEHPTRYEAQQIAHPWEPITEPIFTEEPMIDDITGSIRSSFQPVPGHVAVKRSDTGGTIGVVSETYTPINNAEMYEIAEAIEGEAEGSVQYETGGSLKGGSKVWLLIRLRDPLIIGGDESTATIPYYALQNSHDGSGSFRGQATMTRIVCDNTSQVADLDARARGTEFTFRHTTHVQGRIDDARVALAGWRESIETYRMLSEHLLDSPIGRGEAETFVDRFIPAPLPSTATERVMTNVENARGAFWKIYRGETNERIAGTRYGLVQAAVEYLNHARRTTSEESRFKRSYLDRNKLMADAARIAQAV